MIKIKRFCNNKQFSQKFNSNPLKSSSFCYRVLALISEVKPQGDLSPKNKWERLKYAVRTNGIKAGKRVVTV